MYDGHGGHEVATYCAKNLPDFIKQTEAYKRGDIAQALIDAFLGFDATLTKPEVVSMLKELAGTGSDKNEGDSNESGAFFSLLEICIVTGYTLVKMAWLIAQLAGSSLLSSLRFPYRFLINLSSCVTLRIDEEENVSNLCMEATMPLEQVMAKYHQSEISNSHVKNLKAEKCGKRACFASPFLRGRRGREKAGCSSSGAGCSSSPLPPPPPPPILSQSSSASSASSPATTPWNTNETDVSSSSQPCGSSLSSTVERKETDCPASNEAEQVLDSTTSNGNSSHASTPVGSTADVEPAKSMDMPDSSEDVTEEVSSPSKAPCAAEPNANDADVNGAETKRIGDADSSNKGGGDNVSSSSCTPVENGDAGQQERITSSGRRRIQPMDLYQSLLKKDNDDSEEDDDDDENDETFDGVHERYVELAARFDKETTGSIICIFELRYHGKLFHSDDTEDVDEEEDESDDDDDEIEGEDIDEDSDEESDEFMVNTEKVRYRFSPLRGKLVETCFPLPGTPGRNSRDDHFSSYDMSFA